MIRYALRCADTHEFEGWFRDSVAFDHQAASGLLTCPECGSAAVTRALMAPAVARRTDRPAAAAAPTAPVAAPGPAPGPARVPAPVVGGPAAAPTTMSNAANPAAKLPDAMRAALQRLRSIVEQQGEHVGPAFTDQALAMHRGETPHRPIYGDATEAQCEMLQDEGVAVQAIPWIGRADG